MKNITNSCTKEMILKLLMHCSFIRVDDSSAYKYIDCFNGGRFLSERQCLDLLYSPMANEISVGVVPFVRATPIQVID